MRELVWMYRGKLDGELDLHWAATDDGWERDSRVLSMLHGIIVTVSNMFGGKMRHESADHFNDSLKVVGDDSVAVAEGDYPWAKPAGIEHEKAITDGNKEQY